MLAPHPVDLADSAPATGAEDEVWMVSYMDIMTLLLTLFVLLFVYARVAAPEAAAETPDPVDPHKVEALRDSASAAEESRVANFDARQIVTLPPRWLDSFVTQPIPELAIFAGNAPEDADAMSSSGRFAAEPGAVAQTSALAPLGIAIAATPAVSREPRVVSDARQDQESTAVGQDSTAALPQQEPEALPGGSPAALRDAAPIAQAALVASPPLQSPPDTSPPLPGEKGKTLLAALEASDIGSRIEVTRRENALDLEISDEILFDRGSATLTFSGEALLAEVAKLLRQLPAAVSVEGHTDNSPIQTARFASNWELSAARSTNVTRFLVSQSIDPARLRTVGYADTRPRADNASEQGRARNRRVTLVLHVLPEATVPH